MSFLEVIKNIRPEISFIEIIKNFRLQMRFVEVIKKILDQKKASKKS